VSRAPREEIDFEKSKGGGGLTSKNLMELVDGGKTFQK